MIVVLEVLGIIIGGIVAAVLVVTALFWLAEAVEEMLGPRGL